jgi:formylglycine-generating enzyme required for sulfatase activity
MQRWRIVGKMPSVAAELRVAAALIAIAVATPARWPLGAPAQASDNPAASASDRNLLADRLLTVEQERALRPMDRFRECGGCPEMVVIPEGAFMMGSSKGEGDGDEVGPNGRPLRVTIRAPYALGRFIVTVGEYLRCVAEQGCAPPAWQEPGSPYNIATGNDSHFKRLGDALTDARHPIVGVSWSNAQSFVGWLNAKLALPRARRYRLPSEAEWERAARGGYEGRKYFWGNEFNASAANATGEGGADKWTYTSPVGSFPPNPYGLYDIHGNAWQWIEDCYHMSYATMPAVVRDTGIPWTSACDDAGRRVLRGGSWIDDPRVLRAADRGGSPPDIRYSYVGFRVARTLDR